MSAILAAVAAVGVGWTLHLGGWTLMWLGILGFALAPSDAS